MAETTIEWTSYTFNPVEGCEKVSPGCKHCYAEAKNKWLKAGRNWGPKTPREPRSDAYWRDPLVWDKKARLTGVRPRVFCASVADVCEDHPDWVEPRRRLLNLIDATPHLDWLLLTKRPENILRFFFSPYELDHKLVRQNVWWGTTVEDDLRALERIRILREIPAVVRFLSCEPLLMGIRPELTGIDWVIIGGESGGGARRFDVAWARTLIKQARKYGAAPFVKQLGANIIDRDDAGFEAESETWAEGPDAGQPTRPGAWPTPKDVEFDIDGHRDDYQGAPVRVRLHDKAGGDMAEWPLDLRVREFPQPRSAHG